MPADIPWHGGSLVLLHLTTFASPRVVAAFDLVMDAEDSTGMSEDSHKALAAALRELVAVVGRKVSSGGYILPGRVLTEADILAIADSIEQAVTYAEPPADA